MREKIYEMVRKSEQSTSAFSMEYLQFLSQLMRQLKIVYSNREQAQRIEMQMATSLSLLCRLHQIRKDQHTLVAVFMQSNVGNKSVSYLQHSNYILKLIKEVYLYFQHHIWREFALESLYYLQQVYLRMHYVQERISYSEPWRSNEIVDTIYTIQE